MENKKLIEREQLEKFISNEKMKFIVHNITNSETPDFIVNINKRNISIEHTTLIHPELKKVENYRNKIIDNAKKKFEEKYSDYIYTLVTFKNIQLKSGKKEEQKYTDEVFKLIEQIYLTNKNFKFNISSKRRRDNVSEIIEYFSVDNVHNFSHWQHFGAFLVDWIDVNWLQKIILKKENNLGKYANNFNENWLLLVSNFGTKPSAYRTDFIDFSVIKSKFDKIYLYCYREDEVQIIK
jgi:hypothetical protein